jgi:hypothetical protein
MVKKNSKDEKKHFDEVFFSQQNPGKPVNFRWLRVLSELG